MNICSHFHLMISGKTKHQQDSMIFSREKIYLLNGICFHFLTCETSHYDNSENNDEIKTSQ